jgi:hypothetical protein
MVPNFGNIVLPRLVATALSVLLVVWAGRELIFRSAGTTVRSLITAVDAIGHPKTEILYRIQELASGRMWERCDPLALNAIVEVSLTEVDGATAAADPIRTDRAVDVAETAIRTTLRCRPIDGDLWLKLVSLDVARGAPSERTIEHIRLSHWTAPSEGRIVRRRVDLASRLLEKGLADIRPELHSDIRVLVNFDAIGNIADLFVTAPESVRPIYREWIELLPTQRRSELTKAVEGRGSSLNAS